MAKLWQYTIAVILTLLVWVGFLWALFGHSIKKLDQHCNNTDTTRLKHPLIYIPSRDDCFRLYTQGPCKDGDWLTIEELVVSCKENLCIGRFDSRLPDSEQVVVPFNDKCYKLGESCGSRKEIITYGASGYPNCTQLGNNSNSTINTVSVIQHGGSCPPGSFMVKGFCTAPTDVDLD